MSQRIGVVLAGGAGRRMGEPKGPMVFEGRTLAERAAVALAPVCTSVLVSVSPGAVNPAPRFQVVEDAAPAGRGPLCGIEAAFKATGSSDLLVLACDYPWATADLLRAIVKAAPTDADVIFPVDDRGRDHPLVGLWRRGAEPVVNQALANRVHKVRAILADLSAFRLHRASLPGVDLAATLRNVNEPVDLST